MSRPTLDSLVRAPKALLHDHLDGGVRPATVVELADACGYTGLPTKDVGELARVVRLGRQPARTWCCTSRVSTTRVAVMQTREALMRVAAECAEDLAADGIVYAEIRFAPELHTEGELGLDEVVGAVHRRLRGRIRAAAAAGHPITVYALLTAMRTQARSVEIAELAVRWRDDGVVGFDIAGAEAGFPPTRHLDAFQSWPRENFHITIHAGEAFGLPSIWEALQWCGAERLGHGVRIVDDITEDPDGTAGARAARGVRARPAGAARDVPDVERAAPARPRRSREHPIGLLRRLRFRVTVNTDNRLMSDTSLSTEFAALVDAFGYGLGRRRVAHDQRHEERVRAVSTSGSRIINERSSSPASRWLKAEEVAVGSR